jgi:hypothetical protein
VIGVIGMKRAATPTMRFAAEALLERILGFRFQAS